MSEDKTDQAVAEVRSLFHQTPGEPYGYLRELRDECPVHWDPLLRGYFLTRYADVREVMSDAERFRLQTRPEEQYDEHQSPARVKTFRTLLREGTLGRYVPTILVPELDRLLSPHEPTGRIELFAAVADPFPGHVIGTLFGLEPSDMAQLMAYRDARSAVFNAPPDQVDALSVVAQEWQEQVDRRMREVIADHRERPQDDLITWLLEAEEDGEPISEDQIIQIAVRDLLIAGSETVTRSICNTIYRLLTVDALYARVRADRSLVPGLVEEALRYDPPAQIFWRAAEEDVEISGCPISKDAQIYTSLAGANRDPEKFAEPDAFDIGRKVGHHLSFSVGAHRCPGAWLGRTETELAVNTILDRLPNLRLDPDADPPEFREVVLRHWSPLHLRFDPVVR